MKLSRRELLLRTTAGFAAAAVPGGLLAEGLQDRADAIRNLTQHGPIHLDLNENAYGASKNATVALQRTAHEANRYPDLPPLREKLAARHGERQADGGPGVTAEQILVGCGSSDVLRMAAEELLGPRKMVIQGEPTCGVLAGFAEKAGARIRKVPLRKDHAHDLQGMMKVARERRASGIIYLCNPNSPTGTLTPRTELQEFVEQVPQSFYVVVDEAYHEYAGGSGAYVSFVEKPANHPRVLVSRTFSAAHGLAGARVGYGVAGPELIRKLERRSLPFAVSRGGAAAAVAALEDRAHIEECVRRNADDRQEFMNQVNARMLRALDSHTNFVCLNVMRPATEILKHYRTHNFALAPTIATMPTYLRISLGTPAEMAEFWRVWDLLGSHPMSM